MFYVVCRKVSLNFMIKNFLLDKYIWNFKQRMGCNQFEFEYTIRGT